MAGRIPSSVKIDRLLQRLAHDIEALDRKASREAHGGSARREDCASGELLQVHILESRERLNFTDRIRFRRESQGGAADRDRKATEWIHHARQDRGQSTLQAVCGAKGKVV